MSYDKRSVRRRTNLDVSMRLVDPPQHALELLGARDPLLEHALELFPAAKIGQADGLVTLHEVLPGFGGHAAIRGSVPRAEPGEMSLTLRSAR